MVLRGTGQVGCCTVLGLTLSGWGSGSLSCCYLSTFISQTGGLGGTLGCHQCVINGSVATAASDLVLGAFPCVL